MAETLSVKTLIHLAAVGEIGVLFGAKDFFEAHSAGTGT